MLGTVNVQSNDNGEPKMPPDYLITTSIPASNNHSGLDGGESPAKRERLVRAKNEAAALKHVVADTIVIERATIDDAMRLANIGTKLEIVAGDAA